MKPATKRQTEVLRAIAQFWNEGRPPTTGELLESLNLATESGLTNLLKPLAREGYLTLRDGVRGRQRLIELTSQGWLESGLGFPKFPVVGHITAGVLEEAFETDVEWYDNPGNCLGVQPRDFGLRVKGNSMIGAHIIPGDCVVIRPRIQAQNGNIVAALVRNEEDDPPLSTLKYLHFLPEPHLFCLRAANPEFEDIIVEGEDLRIAGVAKGLIRRLDD
jgi:repressor LexA